LSTMATQELIKYHIPMFWDDEYKRLDYTNELFNDPASVELWTSQGYANQFTGDMCDMRGQQPSWNKTFIDIYTEMGWKDIGTSYYRMSTGTILPVHSDLYVRYIDLFGLAGQEHRIRRAVVFLEDWQSGHYFEGAEKPVVNWQAGDVVEWIYDLPHMAANVGLDPRYTLQITGWV
jgi:hypothetical protein